MSAPHPTSLKPPSINSNPMIQLRYEADFGDFALPGFTMANWPTNTDDAFRDTNFYLPSRVGQVQIAALENLSEATFSGLCKAMEPMWDGMPIMNKADLQALALLQEPEINAFEEEKGHANLSQIESFFMSEALVSPYVHWGKLADLYNSSDVVQQKALLGFFTQVLNRDLVELLNIQEPELTLPTSLAETYETRVMVDDIYIIDLVNKALVREDIFMTKYTVSMDDADNTSCLMFSAPSLSQAMAKGVTYLRDPVNTRFSNMRIWHEDEPIATGRLHWADMLAPVETARMIWRLEEFTDKASFDATATAVEQAIVLHERAVSGKANDQEVVHPSVILTKTSGFRPATKEEACAKWIEKQESGPLGIDPLVKAFLQSNPEYLPSIPSLGSRQAPTKAKWEAISNVMVTANKSRTEARSHLFPEKMLYEAFTPGLVRELLEFAGDHGFILQSMPSRFYDLDDGLAF
ncbi:hypothetical protein V0M98_36655 (plasmid) [Pseudomonas silesiensis]|uniref:hypothetical protein n=1 Tax=Pseudomonas silesiensis TaxID=1853130 RepID=UPI0030D5A7FD